MAIPYGYNMNAVGKSAVNSINNLATQANQKNAEATGMTRSGLQTLLDADPSASVSKIRGYGDQIAGIAGSLPQYATDIKGLSGNMSDSATELFNYGTGLLGTSQGILSGDTSSGLAKSLFGIYNQYDPENGVSLAVQDVNNSYDVGNGQLLRTMSRSGVNPSSGRYAALQQQQQIALNTARAAAATRARQLGLDKQAAAFQNLVIGTGTTLGNLAKDYLLGSVSANANAVNALDTAAGIEKSSASLFGEAASIEKTAVNTELGYAGSVTSQQNTVASALQKEGATLDTQSARELSFLSARLSDDAANWRASLNANTSTTTSAYDPWEATGHTSTYWKNSLNSSDYTDMANNMALLSAMHK